MTNNCCNKPTFSLDWPHGWEWTSPSIPTKISHVMQHPAIEDKITVFYSEKGVFDSSNFYSYSKHSHGIRNKPAPKKKGWRVSHQMKRYSTHKDYLYSSSLTYFNEKDARAEYAAYLNYKYPNVTIEEIDLD